MPAPEFWDFLANLLLILATVFMLFFLAVANRNKSLMQKFRRLFRE